MNLLLALLLVSAGLGIVACIRRGAGIGSWVLGAAIVCTAAIGVWRYVHLRSVSASHEERLRRDMAAFVAVSPARIPSDAPVRMTLTWSVGDVHRDVSALFSGPLQIGLTRRIVPNGEDTFRYSLRADHPAVTANAAGDRVLVTIDADAKPDGETTSPRRLMAIESTEIRADLPSPDCADACTLTDARVFAAGEWFCATGIRPLPDGRSFAGRLAACGVR